MARLEIVMETPAAKQLEAAVQRKLAEFSYSTADDVVMAEYVVVMLANAKTPEEITAELTELIGEDMYDPVFTEWLFEELARQYGPPATQSASTSEPPLEANAKSSQAGVDAQSDQDASSGGKIQTVTDSREPFSNNRGPVKRPGNGPSGTRPNQGVFNQALGGLKRAGGNDILKDTPPHRRLRGDEPFSGGIPTGPRSMDRDPRDAGRPNVMPPRMGGGMMGTNNRDLLNNQRPPHTNFASMRGGFGSIADAGAKSILERAGVVANVNRSFPNQVFTGGFEHGQSPVGRPAIAAPLHGPFFNPGASYPAQIAPNHQFPQHPFPHQPPPNTSTPQLFLANGQPYIPPHPLSHPLAAPGGSIAPMYHQVLINAPNNGHTRLSAQSPSFNPGQHIGFLANSSVGQPHTAPPATSLPPLPVQPRLRQECKYNLECKDAWCPSSHCPPGGDTKTSMLLNFEACEKQLQCQDSGCSKAHVSPQQRDPKSSIRIPSMAVAATPIVAPSAPHGASISPSPNLTACRFGAHCTRADCHFTHPWGAKPSPGGDPAEVGKDGSNPAFSTIRCKFGLACTRQNCHFQHPPKKAVISSFRTPSKNISKTFNNQEHIVTAPGHDATKLPPSKKFSISQPEASTPLPNKEHKVKTEEAEESDRLSNQTTGPVQNTGSGDAKLITKPDANNGLHQHSTLSDRADIKPVVPLPLNASTIVS